MDERFRGNGMWIGIGALGVLFLCILLSGALVFTLFVARSGPSYGAVPYVQPPVAEEGAAPPAVPVFSQGSLGRSHGGPFSFVFGAIGGLFRLAFFGLLLFLLLGLVKRVFWGPRCWGPRPWGPHYHGQPPQGKPWKHRSHPHRWGPWTWYCQDEPETTAAANGESDESVPEYTGPQE